MSDVVLKVDKLHTSFPIRRTLIDRLLFRPQRVVRAVDGISFELRRGEMLALVGESGCGKTTTIQTIQRMVRPTSGSVMLGDRELTSLSRRAMRPLRRRVQMIYQDPYESLDPRFRVRKTVEEPLRIHRIGRGDERGKLVEEALVRAGLSPADVYSDRYPHELSGGQRQRVAIAASLVLGPDLLLADEPVSMLDVSVRAGVLSLLDGLRKNGDMAILMITHDLSTAAHFAERIAVMYLGRIVEQGPAREVVKSPRHPYTKALLSVVPRADPRERMTMKLLEGETPNPIDIPPGCRFAPRCPMVEEQCLQTDPQLGQPSGEASTDHQVACLLA